MRFGLIGAGRIGRIHGTNVAARKDSQLVSIADADAKSAEALAAETGAKVDSLDALLSSSDIDAVLVCAPTDMHADLIERAAHNNKAVFCEKPVDLSSSRIRECLKVVEATNTPLMIGFNRRFDPNFAALKIRLVRGLAGDIELIHIISRDPSPPPISYIHRSGGLFRDMMIHDFDLARFLLGEEPISVFATGSSLVDKAIGEAGDFDTAAVIMETSSGKIAQISNSRRATYGYDQRIEVHGSKGLIRAQNVHESTVELATEAGFATDPVQNFFLERYSNAYRLELEHFVQSVTKGHKPHPNGYDGLRAQMLSDAATESAHHHKRIEIPA